MVRCYKNCGCCGYHEHATPCCPPHPCEHDILCADPVCARPCWDTCKCMDEILKLQSKEDTTQVDLEQFEGRIIKVENDVKDFNDNLTNQIDCLAQKEQHDVDCLRDKLNEEKERAMAEEQRIEARVATEEERAQAAEAAIAEDLDQEIERATNRENEIDNRVAAEEQRAQDKEAELDQAIADEVQRATDKEDELDDRIAAEEERAQNKENDIEGALNREINRATNNEDRIEDLVNAEEDRAENREDEIAANLAAESSDRLMNAITGAEYVPAQKKINFKRQNGDIVATIDATDFVRDGMVDSVVWDPRTEEIVITWNTDSGKDPIVSRIPGSAIFNPNDYYTAAQIDEKETLINTNISLLNANLSTTGSNLTSLTQKVNDTVDYGQTIDWGTTEAVAKVNGTTINVGIPSFPSVVSRAYIDEHGKLYIHYTDRIPDTPDVYELPTGYVNRVATLEEITEQQQNIINNLTQNVIPQLEAKITALEGLWEINPNDSNQVIAKSGRSAAAHGFYDTDPNMI